RRLAHDRRLRESRGPDAPRPGRRAPRPRRRRLRERRRERLRGLQARAGDRDVSARPTTPAESVARRLAAGAGARASDGWRGTGARPSAGQTRSARARRLRGARPFPRRQELGTRGLEDLFHGVAERLRHVAVYVVTPVRVTRLPTPAARAHP